MYEQFMKSKIANRWGTSFKHVISEEGSKEASTVSRPEKATKGSSSLSLETTKTIKKTQSSTY